MNGRARRAFIAAVVWLAALPAAAQVQNWPSEDPPQPLEAREVTFPPYEVRTLENGLQIIVVQHHEQPAVSLRLLIRAGAAQDPTDKPGVAALVASLLDQGTTKKGAREIADTIDTIGGALGAGAGTDLSFVNVIVMNDSLALGFDLLADVVRRPAFAPDEIERQRQQTLSSLQVSTEDPEYVANTVIDRLIYGFHPYGRPTSGTPESIASIARADLKAFHDTFFAPNNCVLAVVGDVDADAAFPGIQRAFGDWARREIPESANDGVPGPTRRVVVVDRPGAVQTEIRVGHVAIPRKHPDFLALNMAAKILGGEGANRLHGVLRTQRGLTYGASADLDSLKQSGGLVGETDTRSDATAEVLRLIVDEFWRLQRDRVGTRELADVKAYLTGNFPLTIETPDAIALQVLNAVFYGLDLEEVETFRERVDAITPDDIQRVARAYLRPDRLSVVLVGDASRFIHTLHGAGFDTVERVPLTDLDLSTADLKRAAAHQ